MKKILPLIGGLLVSAAAFGQTETFRAYVEGLPAASAFAGTEKLYCDQSSTSTQCTPNQLLTFITGGVTGIPYLNGTSPATAASAANVSGLFGGATGTGLMVLQTSPTLTTPNLGTPSAINLTNATALPLTTGVTGVLPLANGGNNSTNGSTLATNATGYTLSNVSGNITSGTTGFGENWVGTVNDASAVDGIIGFANITCTTCTATSYLVDWQVGGATQFNVTTGGVVNAPGTARFGALTINASGALVYNGQLTLLSPAGSALQMGTNSATPTNMIFEVNGSRGGTDSNVAGGNLQVRSGLGTGNATGSTLALQVPAPTTAGTAQQTAYTEFSATSSAIAIGDTTNHPAVTVNGVTTLAPAANNYSLQNTSGSITSGTTGFGENWVGTVNDSSTVDGIIGFANITCTNCNANASNIVDWQVGGVSQFKVSTLGNTVVNGTLSLGGSSAFSWTSRAILSSPAAAQLQLGSANSATPVNQTLLTQGSRGGTDTNVAGANLTIQSGLGTGNATGSTLSLQTPHSGSSGTTAQTANTQVLLGDNTVGFPNIATGAGSGYLCYGASNTMTTSTSACGVSNEVYKWLVEDMQNGLATVRALRPATWFWKSGYDAREEAGKQQEGFIAQEVERVDPNLVTYDADGTVHGVKYQQMTAVLAKAVQEVDEKVDTRDAAIAFQQREIEILYGLVGLLAGWSVYLTFRGNRK